MKAHVHKLLTRAIGSGTATGLASAAVASAGALHWGHGPCRAMNAVTHCLWRDASWRRRPSAKYTALGTTIHMGSAVFWGVLFEALCERGYRRSGAINIANAAATTALATYVVDYHVVPKRITPGFESHLSKDSLGLTYVALGAGFALAAVLRLVHDADRVAALELPSTGRNSSFAGLSCADTSGR
ncbi:hypothetical protein BSFA1_77580 (plasmid) [Burkholderia sp. SFA1]|nr:conserved hypothetical protein [Burkholderia sp. YI23]KAK43752.1 hypothetical protein BG58_29265 [Caballeronia jiangsuensis]BAO92557.1 uncharacterized protein BRPE67_ECDS00600 [Burkholderia sp. RPE67]BBQ02630.1 hypothetical protein BSFA1_77580 [Burkholderia sp. SFA1]